MKYFSLFLALTYTTAFASDLPKKIECTQNFTLGIVNGVNRTGQETFTVTGDGATNGNYSLSIVRSDDLDGKRVIAQYSNLECQFAAKGMFSSPEDYIFSCMFPNQSKRVYLDHNRSLANVMDISKNRGKEFITDPSDELILKAKDFKSEDEAKLLGTYWMDTLKCNRDQ